MINCVTLLFKKMNVIAMSLQTLWSSKIRRGEAQYKELCGKWKFIWSAPQKKIELTSLFFHIPNVLQWIRRKKLYSEWTNVKAKSNCRCFQGSTNTGKLIKLKPRWSLQGEKFSYLSTSLAWRTKWKFHLFHGVFPFLFRWIPLLFH